MHHRDRLHRRRSGNEPGHVHELTFGCYRGYPFLKAERTCRWLAEAVEKARQRRGFDLWAFVFMPEHVHLLVRPFGPDATIANILRDIKRPVGWQAFRHLDAQESAWRARLTRIRNGRTERLFWQPGGGYDRNVAELATLAAMIGYIHRNPVRRGQASRPEDWHWSSAAWFAGGPGCELQPDRIPPEWC